MLDILHVLVYIKPKLSKQTLEQNASLQRSASVCEWLRQASMYYKYTSSTTVIHFLLQCLGNKYFYIVLMNVLISPSYLSCNTLKH